MQEKIDELALEEAEAREIRRKMADWKFIESLPPRLREALKYYIEKGDIRLASKLSGLSVEEFRDLLRKAKIPVIV